MLFSKKEKTLLSVCTGECCPLTEMPDEAFSSGILGNGVAIRPTDGCFFSPCNGIVEGVSEEGHAYTIRSEDGLELLIHIGVDTVSLKGEGFRPLVQSGEAVLAGAPLAEAKLKEIESRGLPTVTALLISNPEITQTIEYRYGRLEGGRDAAMVYRIGRKG
ncbi:MAG: PTS glucose transporter subunit IIA [Ruminococcaceae bacterium]|nr:PTS glucose transporter subunit IIA [Oscillospiraceae bacterium]